MTIEHKPRVAKRHKYFTVYEICHTSDGRDDRPTIVALQSFWSDEEATAHKVWIEDTYPETQTMLTVEYTYGDILPEWRRV